MSSGFVPVTLHAVESNFVGPWAHDADTPYQRIVGVRIGEIDPTELWTPLGGGADQFEYKVSDAEQHTIEMTSVIASRLGSFFNRFYVEGPQYQLANPHEEILPEFYSTNCHRFGYWMKGVVAAQRTEIPDAPDHITSEGFRARPAFKLGTHAVLGNGYAVHSVSGLGVETNDCLQVLSSEGPMSIDTYDNVLAGYDPDGSRGHAYYV